jgi:hypothetical protein
MSERTEVFKMWSNDEWMNAQELGMAMLEGYVEKWRNFDTEYEIIASEQTFELPIGSIEGYRIVCVGTMDGVWRHLPTGKIRFAEHKTGVSIVTDALPLNEQAGAYWTFGPRWLRLQKLIGANDEFDGILYNFLRKSMPDKSATYDEQGRKLNKDGSVSKRQPSALFHRELVFRGQHEAEMVKERIKLQVRDMILAREHPEAHIYKSPGPQFFPNCRLCPFKDMCEVHETGNNWQSMLTLYDKWEPYAAHEKIERT